MTEQVVPIVKTKKIQGKRVYVPALNVITPSGKIEHQMEHASFLYKVDAMGVADMWAKEAVKNGHAAY